MAHMIDNSRGRAAMAYRGATPWHGLGSELTEDATIETWQREAGMDYDIKRSRVVFRWGKERGQVGAMDDRFVLWRDDTHAPLAVVSDRYQIVQPSEVLEFFRDLVDATGDYQLETAGVLNDGARYWALAKYRDSLQFGDDQVLPYLLLATACDGTMATTAQHTSVRVVCNNTLQMSLGAHKADAIKVRHNTRFDAFDVKAQLGIGGAISDFREDVETLIAKSMTPQQTADVFVELIAKRDSAGEITNEKNVKRVTSEIMRSLDFAPGARTQAARGTAWGAMNAVTHYVDFRARARSDNNRFNSGQFGPGAKLKERAFELLAAA